MADEHQHQQSNPLFDLAKKLGIDPTFEERDLAFFAHMFPAVANLIFLGFAVPVVAPLLVLTFTKKRTHFVLFHINQSVAFQAVLFAIYIVLGIFATIAVILMGARGFLFITLAACVPVTGFVYALVLAFSAKNGEWSEYIFIGKKVLESRNPLVR